MHTTRLQEFITKYHGNSQKSFLSKNPHFQQSNISRMIKAGDWVIIEIDGEPRLVKISTTHTVNIESGNDQIS